MHVQHLVIAPVDADIDPDWIAQRLLKLTRGCFDYFRFEKEASPDEAMKFIRWLVSEYCHLAGEVGRDMVIDAVTDDAKWIKVLDLVALTRGVPCSPVPTVWQVNSHGNLEQLAMMQIMFIKLSGKLPEAKYLLFDSHY